MGGIVEIMTERDIEETEEAGRLSRWEAAEISARG